MTAAVLACVARLHALGFPHAATALSATVARGVTDRDSIAAHLAVLIRCYQAVGYCGSMPAGRRSDAADAARACWAALDVVRAHHVVMPERKEAA